MRQLTVTEFALVSAGFISTAIDLYFQGQRADAELRLPPSVIVPLKEQVVSLAPLGITFEAPSFKVVAPDVMRR